MNKNKCLYCDIDSSECEVFHDYPFTDHDWYLYVQTGHWDDYNDDWDYEKVYIRFCPYCGRDLRKK